MSQEPEWFFVRDGEVAGPISVPEVVSRIRLKAFDRQTLLWREGMEGWVPLSKTDFALLCEPEPRDETTHPISRVPSPRALPDLCLRWLRGRARRFRVRWSWRSVTGLLQGAAILALVLYVLLSLLPVARRSRALRNEMESIASRATLTADPTIRSYVVAALSRHGLREEQCEIQMERRPGTFTLRLRYVEEPALFGYSFVLRQEETVKSPTFEFLQELRETAP